MSGGVYFGEGWFGTYSELVESEEADLMANLGEYIYLRPDENIAAGSTVSGSVDTGYQASWLCDMRTDHPARVPDGDDLSLTVTFPSTGNVDLVVLSHTNLSEDATIGGSFSGTITADPDYALDGIPLNRFLYGTVVSASGLTVDVTGNALPATIGELFAGVARTLRPFQFGNMYRRHDDFAGEMRGKTMSQLPYREGAAGIPFWGGGVYSSAEVEDIIRWRRAQKESTMPSVLIPCHDASVDYPFAGLEAITCIFDGFSWQATEVVGMWGCTFHFMEIPRTLW